MLVSIVVDKIGQPLKIFLRTLDISKVFSGSMVPFCRSVITRYPVPDSSLSNTNVDVRLTP